MGIMRRNSKLKVPYMRFSKTIFDVKNRVKNEHIRKILGEENTVENMTPAKMKRTHKTRIEKSAIKMS